MRRIQAIVGVGMLFCITNCSGMIESIGIFTNDKPKHEVCIVGQEMGVALPEETNAFHAHLKRWAAAPQAPACFIPLDKRLVKKKLELEAATLKKMDGLYLCNPLTHVLDLARKHADNYRNMRFNFLPTDRMFEFQLSYFSNHLHNFFQEASRIHNLSWSPQQYDAALLNKALRKKIFGPGGFFGTLKSIALENYEKVFKEFNEPLCCVADYFAQYDEMMEHFKHHAQSTSSSKLKKVLEAYLQAGQHARTKLKAFFDQHATNTQDSLIGPQLTALSKGAPLFTTYNEIKAATMPCISVVNSLKTLIALVKLLDQNPRVFLFCGQNIALELHQNFKSLDYTASCQGNLQTSFGSLIRGERRFTLEGLNKLLATVFCDVAMSDQKTQQDALQIAVIPPIYVHPENDTTSDRPFHDAGRYVCIACSHTLDAYYHYAIATDQRAYCSFKCFMEDLQKKKRTSLPLLTLLDSTHELTQDDRLILKRCGALIHYAMLPLLDALPDDRSMLYTCNHTKLIKLLEKAHKKIPTETHDKDLQLWHSASELAKIFGADSLRLTTILNLTQGLKKNHLAKLLEQARLSNYKKLLTDEECVSFDQANFLSRLQKEYLSYLIRQLEFSNTTKRTTLYSLYKDLIALITQRLQLPELDFEATLSENIQIDPSQQPERAASNRVQEFDDIKICADSFLEELEETVGEEEPESEQSASVKPEPTPALKPFKPVQKRPYSPIKRIQSFFASRAPYSITLFNARKQFASTPESLAAQERWRNCTEFNEAYRIKMLFALLESGMHGNDITYNDDHGCLLNYAPTKIDASLQDKLDLHHLFTRHVDPYLFSCGIAEKVDNLIQVSIPGALVIKGKLQVGFFQYSFYPDSWMCMHRCFKEYYRNPDDSYISRPLRKALCEFLKEHMADNREYIGIINDLERLTK